MAHLLPPNASPMEKALDQLIEAGLADINLASVSTLWSPDQCPVDLLPWLAWGLSIDRWHADWSEVQKRAAIADAIPYQMRKGTPLSLRAVIDRYNPLIRIVEWFETNGEMEPYWFRLELPLAAESALQIGEDAVRELLRDIDRVKPLRAHMHAVHRVATLVHVWLLGGGHISGSVRRDTVADRETALETHWLDYLETEDGEPVRSEAGPFLEVI